MNSPLHIAIIASARYPIAEPFAGGLESHTWTLANGLRRRGHRVSLFAAEGSDPNLAVTELAVRRVLLSDAARDDVSMPPGIAMQEHHAYMSLMLDLSTGDGTHYDIIHNNSLHHLPVAMARLLSQQVVTTLHTPPTPWLESAISAGPCPVTFTAVSEATARAWQHVTPDAAVIRNGVDLDAWRPGPGGEPLVWFGRLVPEKGPDLAIRAARLAGVPLILAGPAPDRTFFRTVVEPLLGEHVRYVGHRARAQLVQLLGHARACLVTPRWDEPYGLVAAEALACGTPVLGFARGGVPEVVDDTCAVLVPGDDVDALAAAIPTSLSRTAARTRAEQHCSQTRMIGEYESLYRRLAGHGALSGVA